MFLGKFEHSLDDKNRVVLPLAYRRDMSEEKLQEGFVIFAGSDEQYLELHTKEKWLLHSEELKKAYAAQGKAGEQDLIDLYSNAYEVQLDKQYRFIVPDSSMELAGIKRDVVFVGMTEKAVIYSRERWEVREKGRRKARSAQAKGS